MLFSPLWWYVGGASKHCSSTIHAMVGSCIKVTKSAGVTDPKMLPNVTRAFSTWNSGISAKQTSTVRKDEESIVLNSVVLPCCGVAFPCLPVADHLNCLIISYIYIFYVTRSDKRVTKCQFCHSELLIPSKSAIKLLSHMTTGYCRLSHCQIESYFRLFSWRFESLCKLLFL